MTNNNDMEWLDDLLSKYSIFPDVWLLRAAIAAKIQELQELAQLRREQK